ncbi:hypothetical protein ASPTUDRAFT_618593 [Aspergillus tubingensis CBS 134.48]|uniref:F-box domain-containing protein n=1 Tax=Aspergillus tubingensis (strain CBS 134.48) TaxID=767770 RepID=A0A1L9N390_ASPTC|nr:hypothetical protein ASPTUDRAFT_618593 [Aspergillus tubingensis CBS 134.48]
MSCSGTADTPTILASPLALDFLDLPIKIRNSIYKQVLVLPHPLHIFQDPGCPLEAFAPEKPGSWLALTYVSRQISDETRMILYSMNRFIFHEMETACRPGTLLESFLNCIGPKNSGILSHLCINFPVTEHISGASGEPRLTDGLRRLQLLRQSCANLKTLEMLIFGQFSNILVANDQMNKKSIRKICLEVNAQIKEIAPLDTIVVRIYNNGTPTAVREFLQELGWIVKFGDA